MPTKTPGEQLVKTVAFGSHGGPMGLLGELNRTDHVASTPYTRQTSNLSNTPHRPLSKMSVVLNPNRNLGFRRPLTQVAKRSLTITNPNSQPVAFKVKTTAPKLYCVRPNSGRVEPGESVDVSVMLQPLKEEPPLSVKCKDKFLVQSTLITPEKETMALHDLWLSPDMNDEGVVTQQKLRVLYLPAEEGLPEEEEENGVKPPQQPSSDLGHQEYQTTKTHANGNSYQGIPVFTQPTPPVPAPVHEPEPQPEVAVPPPVPPVVDQRMSREHSREPHDEERHDTRHIPSQPQESREVPIYDAPEHRSPSPQLYRPAYEEPEETEPIPVPPRARTPPARVSPPPSTIETVYIENPLNEELVQKYKEAQSEIERLRADIATMSVAPTSELRSRRGRRDSDAMSTAETDVQTVIDEPHYHSHQQDGVPLQVVVIVALGVFITTYLFF